MTNVWVIKDDGTRQCDGRNQGTPLEVMQKELEALGAKVLSAEKRQDCQHIPAVCGAPTGQVNAYEISEADWNKIKGSFVGPNGFRLWTCDQDEAAMALVRVEEDPWAMVHQMQRASSVSINPVLVRELVGMPVRCYEDGSQIPQDYLFNRVNIVTEKGSGIIKEIWFG